MASRKENMMESLVLRRLDRVYCKLAPSPLHGIGVFAIKPIPKGTNPFKDSYMAQEAIILPKSKIPVCYKDILNDYHPGPKYPATSSSQTPIQVVSNYPNQPIWTNYINYSTDPNIELMQNGEWETLRDISIGEEVVEDPSRLFNLDGTHKKFTIHQNQYPTLR